MAEENLKREPRKIGCSWTPCNPSLISNLICRLPVIATITEEIESMIMRETDRDASTALLSVARSAYFPPAPVRAGRRDRIWGTKPSTLNISEFALAIYGKVPIA